MGTIFKDVSFSDFSKLSITSLAEARDWLHLPNEITKIILLKAGQINILEHAEYVCKSWYQLCKEPGMWTNIDIFGPHAFFGVPLEDIIKLMVRYDKMRLHAVDRGRDHVLGVTIQTMNNHHLLDIARRAPSLRRLTLIWWTSDLSAIEQALPMMPSLQVFDAIQCFFLDEGIELLGRKAPSLHTLRWIPNMDARRSDNSCDLVYTNGDAFAIAKHLPQLRNLSLYKNPVQNAGLQAILDSCDQLESLDLRFCMNLNLIKNPSLLKRCKQIKYFWLPEDYFKLGAFDYDQFWHIPDSCEYDEYFNPPSG